MVQYIQPANVVVVPRDGALEIKLEITINVNGQPVVSEQTLRVQQEKEPDLKLIPDFSTGKTLKFGKED